MKKIILLTLIFCLAFIFTNGYSLNFPDDFVKDNLPEFIKQLKQTSVLILRTNQMIAAGTGFLTLDKDKNILVVTVEHLTRGSEPIFVRVNTSDKVMDYTANIYRTDSNLDITILTLPKNNLNQQWISTDLVIPIEMYGSNIDIIEGREIIYIGYPLGLGVKEKNYPVSRMGLIAQVLPNSKTFFIDGIGSHGNSGSPVFSRKDGKLLGIVSSFEPDFIDLSEGNKLMARIPFNSGLSRVISIEAIKGLMVKDK